MEIISWMKHWASWALLYKGALVQFPLVMSSSELGPCAWGSMVQLCMSSTGVGRRRERLPTADFLPSHSQPQLRTLVTACWISPGPQKEPDGWTCSLTGSCFLRGNCCFRYHAVACLFGIFLWLLPPAGHNGWSLSTEPYSTYGALGPICGARGDPALLGAALLYCWRQ